MKSDVISIIGIGEVGSVVASLLLSCFEERVFNLMDIHTQYYGRILDLKHAATANNNKVYFNNENVLARTDILIYTAGYCNSVGEDRNAVAHHNKQIVKDVFANRQLPAHTVIIVVTNPVEIISQWIDDLVAPSNLVIGTGTSLDTIRLKYLLADFLDVMPKRVEALVLGEHGSHMTPIWSMCSLDKHPIENYLSENDKTKLTQQLKKSATYIRQTEKSTKYGVAQCVIHILNGLLSATANTKRPLSVRINNYYKQRLDIDKNIFISLWCALGNGTLEITPLPDLYPQEVDALRAASTRLVTVYEQLAN